MTAFRAPDPTLAHYAATSDAATKRPRRWVRSAIMTSGLDIASSRLGVPTNAYSAKIRRNGRFRVEKTRYMIVGNMPKK